MKTVMMLCLTLLITAVANAGGIPDSYYRNNQQTQHQSSNADAYWDYYRKYYPEWFRWYQQQYYYGSGNTIQSYTTPVYRSNYSTGTPAYSSRSSSYYSCPATTTRSSRFNNVNQYRDRVVNNAVNTFINELNWAISEAIRDAFDD